MLRLLAVLALVLAGTGALASTASAEDGVVAAPYEALITTGCGSPRLDLVNASDADVVFMVRHGEGEPVPHVVGPGATNQTDVEDEGPLSVSVDGVEVSPTHLAADCMPSASMTARPCDGQVDVTMEAVPGTSTFDYYVRVAFGDDEHSTRFDVTQTRTVTVPATVGAQVAVGDGMVVLEEITMPECEPEPTAPVEPPQGPAPTVTVASPVPSQEVAVLGTKFSAPVAAAAAPVAPAQTAVLGTKVAATPELARTGPRETAVLTGLGALLVLTGAGLIKAGRRREAPRG